MSKETEEKIIIEDVEYSLNDITENARLHLDSIRFVDRQLQQLNNEWAVADTARIGYTNALKVELSNLKEYKNQ